MPAPGARSHDAHPKELHALLEKLGYADLFGIGAIDPDGVGVEISAPLAETIQLSFKSRERWKMLGAHIASAYRLRRALIRSEDDLADDAHELPFGAEAVLDARDLRIVDAIGPAKDRSAAEILRQGRAACRQSARNATQRRPPQSAGNLEGARPRTLERGGLV